MRTRATITALAATGLLLTACGGSSTSTDWTTGKDVLDALDANGFTCDPPSSGEQVSIDPEPTTGVDSITVECAAGYGVLLTSTRDTLLQPIAAQLPCDDLASLFAEMPETADATLVLGENFMIATVGDAGTDFPAQAQPADFVKAFGGEEVTYADLLTLACEQAGDTTGGLTPGSSGADSPNAGIESALRDAATAMETAYTDTGTYPSDLATAGYSPEGDVDVVVESADDTTYCLGGVAGDTVLFLDGTTGEISDQPCA